MGLSVSVLHFRTSKVAALSPQKRKPYTVFCFLNLGWSLICRKSKTSPQKSFGLCRNNWRKKESNHIVYLNWYLVQISTFYWKESAFIPRIPSHLLFHTKPWKPSQRCWKNLGWKLAKIDAKFAIISTHDLSLFCWQGEKQLLREEVVPLAVRRRGGWQQSRQEQKFVFSHSQFILGDSGILQATPSAVEKRDPACSM